MIESRRYDDREVAEILERAAAASEKARSPARRAVSHGLTLPELQEIAGEVGISPDDVAEAAKAVDLAAAAGPISTFLGAPREVRRSVGIPRPLDDEEWHTLVADLRETFRAQGRISTHGRLRTWSNGNLRAHVEPYGDGYRVRMHTLKGNATAFGGAAGFALLFGGVTALTSVIDGLNVDGLVLGGLAWAAGMVQLTYVRAMLPRWARERAAQMEGLARRIPHMLKRPAAPEASLPTADDR